MQSTGNWTFNQNVDLIQGKEFRIENAQVLSKIKLGDTVATANGLTSIGTLGSLTVTGNAAVGSISSPSALILLLQAMLQLTVKKLQVLQHQQQQQMLLIKDMLTQK